MAEKISHPTAAIDADTFQRGSVISTDAIHLTGGLRAEWTGPADGLWSVQPVLHVGGLTSLSPLSRTALERFALQAGLKVIGGDETSDAHGPLPTRIWTPLYGPRRPHGPADEWSAISVAAKRSDDGPVADLARRISVTINAANIRIRDASDCYHRQLLHALLGGQKVGSRFKNVPLMDLNLAFHSLLSEMASARDYIAEFAGRQLGAPSKVDALNRFEDWAGAASRKSEALADPLAAALMDSKSQDSPNRWLGELTEYRNMFLHRMPIGAMADAGNLVIVERPVQNLTIRVVEMAIPDLSIPGEICDGLTKFVTLHEKLLGLAALAADQAAYSTEPPSFEVR